MHISVPVVYRLRMIRHPFDTIAAAREMLTFIDSYNNGKPEEEIQVRIGIHTGPVVAGIVGIKKFAFDIWGDTVNIAARLEQSGEPGKINISESTYEWVKLFIHARAAVRSVRSTKGRSVCTMLCKTH